MARQAQARTSGKSGGRAALRAAALRQIHTYIGALIAPSVIFFAATGALQLFSLHEAHGGYKPPRLFEQLGSIHKDQRFADKPKPENASPPAADHHGAAEADHDGDDDHDHDHAKAMSWRTAALKWLFLGVAIGLIASTGLGIWMALTFSRRKVVIWALLILGAAAPLLILFT